MIKNNKVVLNTTYFYLFLDVVTTVTQPLKILLAAVTFPGNFHYKLVKDVNDNNDYRFIE